MSAKRLNKLEAMIFEAALALGAAVDPDGATVSATAMAVGRFINHIPDDVLDRCYEHIIRNRIREGGFPDLLNVRDFETAFGQIEAERILEEQRYQAEQQARFAQRMREQLPERPMRHISELARETSKIGQRPVGPRKEQENEGGTEQDNE